VLRVVLGVALAVALLAAVTPALEDARADRTERLAERELNRVGTAAETLAREEAPGARRTLTVSFPSNSPTTVSLASVALGGVSDSSSAVGARAVTDANATAATDTAERDVLAFQIAGGPRHVHRVETDLRVVRANGGLGTDSQALLLGGGTYEVTLRLVRLEDRRIVVVSVL
jgi:hypothetical protein